MSDLIQCVICIFFVIVCEMYLQVLSENSFYSSF